MYSHRALLPTLFFSKRLHFPFRRNHLVKLQLVRSETQSFMEHCMHCWLDVQLHITLTYVDLFPWASLKCLANALDISVRHFTLGMFNLLWTTNIPFLWVAYPISLLTHTVRRNGFARHVVVLRTKHALYKICGFMFLLMIANKRLSGLVR